MDAVLEFSAPPLRVIFGLPSHAEVLFLDWLVSSAWPWAPPTSRPKAPRRIGPVQVMGRDSGFIAAHTTLSTSDVNFCLIPEVPFVIEGENGLLKKLEERLDKRGHAVILVAEGAGQNLLNTEER